MVSFARLHDINPIRLEFIRSRTELAGKRVLDVGCGGGILSEALAKSNADVLGIDAGAAPLTVARMHQAQAGTRVTYQYCTADEVQAREPESFDVVVCMELLEHVPDPEALLHTCTALTRPGGDLFFSTLNRTRRAYLLAMLGAEYLFGLLPKGTHQYQRFIRPSELDAWARRAGLLLRETRGMAYNPFLRRAWLSSSQAVNYIAWFQK